VSAVITFPAGAGAGAVEVVGGFASGADGGGVAGAAVGLGGEEHATSSSAHTRVRMLER
jgi:hypothetical protein